MGSSFTSCFGASTPISPRRTGGHGLLGGQACVNYKKLGFDEDEDEDEGTYTIYKTTQLQEEEELEKEYEHVSQRGQGPFLQHGKQSTLKEEAKKGMQYCASEGEEQYARERKTVMKLGTQWTMREKARMEVYYASELPKEEPYASEQDSGDEYVRERKGILRLGKRWSKREKDGISYAPETPKKQEHYNASDQEEARVYVRERKGLMKLGKLWTMREKARMGVYNASETPKEEEEHNESEGEIDDYGRERKGEMQYGKQWSMREKEEFYGGSPRRESLSRRVREACVQVFESARRSSPHMSELFVGNQLLMQVTSSSFNARRAKNVAPSAGFLVAAGDPPLSVMSPPGSSSSSDL